MKKIFYLLVMISLFLIGCGQNKTESPNGNTVVIGQGAKPKSLDPHMYNSIPDLLVSRQFYNTLFSREKDGSIKPELAESYEYKNEKELDIVLKKSIKFHDGSELTADDVVFSFERMKDKPGSSIMVEEIDKVEKVNDYEVKLFLKNSSSALLYNLAHPITSIVNKKYVEAGNDLSVAPMGTGAFKLIAYNDGEKIELEAFKDYFEGAPKVEKITFRAIPEDTSMLAALETGEVDIATGMPPVSTQTIEANDKLELISEPTTATEYICLNVEKAPFNNKDFRKALNYAIDKQSIIDSIFSGRGKVAKSIVNPNVFGYYDGLEEYPFDPEKAKELIEKSITAIDSKLELNKMKIRITEGSQKDEITSAALRLRESMSEYKSNVEIIEDIAPSQIKYDLIGELTRDTGLTRKTIIGILQGIKKEKFNMYKYNPEEFIRKVANIINQEKAATVINGITYHKTEQKYDNSIFTINNVRGELGENAFDVKKHIYDFLITDSKNEANFAKKLETGEVTVYAKLPNGFKIPTPVGNYNPDWAIVLENPSFKYVYFIAETKGSLDSMELREVEKAKIECARKHFKCLCNDTVKYDVVDSYDTLINMLV